MIAMHRPICQAGGCCTAMRKYIRIGAVNGNSEKQVVLDLTSVAQLSHPAGGLELANLPPGMPLDSPLRESLH